MGYRPPRLATIQPPVERRIADLEAWHAVVEGGLREGRDYADAVAQADNPTLLWANNVHAFFYDVWGESAVAVAVASHATGYGTGATEVQA